MFNEITLGSISIDTYKAMYVVGIIGMFVMCLLTSKKYKTNILRAVVYTVITFVFGVAGAKLMGVIYSNTMSAVSDGAYVPNSGVCIFGALMFLPVFMLILSLGSREKYRKLMDYMTPGIFFILGCAKFGCLLTGCCYGVADENGVVNHNLDYTVFPVQLYESICTFTVVAILIVIMLLRKGNSPKIRYGALYPIGTVLYCGCRIFWENYRHYDVEVEYDFLGSLTYWQHWAIIAIVVSVVWFVILYASKKYSECELEFKKIAIKDFADSFDKSISGKKRDKHAEKAKEHAKKAKELKRK